MNELDNKLRELAGEEDISVPDCVHERVESTLSALPERKHAKIRAFPRIAAMAACLALICLVVLPNCSSAYAQALENVPVIGSIVRVVTIRNYKYSDERHDMDISVPEVENGGESGERINDDVSALMARLEDEFKSELAESGEGYKSVYADYEVVTNTPDWFTLKVTVLETAASSNTYYRFYHIDKRSGEIVSLSDLSDSAEFYSVIENDIRRQMREQMKNDANIIYWVDEADFGENFTDLDAKHNFYWNSDGDLVIAFDKYEVAPGAMGTPEFAISRSLIEPYLKDEYK